MNVTGQNVRRCIGLVLCGAVLASVSAGVVLGQEGIFVPTPRGSGETLDTSPPPAGGGAAGLTPDVVVTGGGDRVIGSVKTMNDEQLILVGGQFVDGVKVRSAAVTALELGGGKTAGGDEVTLANGDRVVGKILSVSQEEVVIDAMAAEPLKISRRYIRSLGIDGGSTLMLKSGFADGQLAPWATVRGGNYSVEDGVMTSNNSGSNYPIAAALEQKEAVTMIVKFKSLDRNGPYVSMMLFVDATDNSYGRNSVFAMFNGNQYYAFYCTNGSTNQIANGNFAGRSMMEGELRMAYDPKTKMMTIWADKNKLGEWKAPNNLESGNHVMFMSQYHTSFSEISVVRGIVPPADTASGDGEEKRDVIIFKNKDRMAVDSVRMADGEFLLTSSYGELKCPAATVSAISFRTEGVEEPRRRKGDARVQTPQGQLTLQFKELTEEHLVGGSDALGDVKLHRDGLKKVEFNVYDKK